MDNINRNLISKVFSYKENDYNYRYGFDDEKYNNTRQLQTAISNQKTFLFRHNFKRGTRVYIDSNNVCFCYLAMCIAIAELGWIIDTKENSDIVIGKDIDIEELYAYKSKDSVLTHNLSQKRMRKETLIYNKLDHVNAIRIARDTMYQYKGNALIISHPDIQYNIHTILLPLLISNNVKQISAIGVNDISLAKDKIEYMIAHLGTQQIFIHKHHLAHVDIPNEVKIFDYS